MARVGVLAVQGAFALHAEALRRLGHRVSLVRRAQDLEDIDGVVLPGGESSVQLAMIERLGLEAPLGALVRAGLPVLATCAGTVLAAAEVCSPRQRSLAFIDIAVERNAWGRQVDSFEDVSDDGSRALVFIRAPRIREVGRRVEVLARLRGEPVLVRQDHVTCATYHPELEGDLAVHAEAFGGPISRPAVPTRGA